MNLFTKGLEPAPEKCKKCEAAFHWVRYWSCLCKYRLVDDEMLDAMLVDFARQLISFSPEHPTFDTWAETAVAMYREGLLKKT